MPLLNSFFFRIPNASHHQFLRKYIRKLWKRLLFRIGPNPFAACDMIIKGIFSKFSVMSSYTILRYSLASSWCTKSIKMGRWSMLFQACPHHEVSKICKISQSYERMKNFSWLSEYIIKDTPVRSWIFSRSQKIHWNKLKIPPLRTPENRQEGGVSLMISPHQGY